MYYLTDSALEWYADEIISNPAIKRWEVVKEKLIQRFGSYNANPIVSASHRRLKREQSIENYFQDKIRLLNQTHLTKEEKIHLLTDGLTNDWKDLIVAAQPTNATKWFHIAASIEQNRASIQFKPKNKIHLATKNNDNRKNVCPFWCPICSKKGIKIKHWVTDCEDYDPNYKKDRPNQNTSVKQVCGAPELLNVSTLTNTPTQGAFKLINISVEVNGIPAQAFVDTGATVSIINWRLFKRTRLQLQPNSDIHISQADGVTRTCGSLQTKIQPPETFDFSTPNEWPKWRKRFERYLVVSGMKKKEEADKIDLFMYLMGDRADDIFRTFKFEKEEEATKLDSVLKAFDSHFCVRKNIIYERAKFNSRIQEDREPVDEFITSLYKLADSCEFEGLHEQLIRDRIVVGVRDKALSERMQLDSELTLEKAVKMVRQQEAVRQQQVDLQRPSTSQKVNQVKFNSKKQSPKQQQQPSRKKEKSAKTRSRCPKCGGFTHREGQACRAEGQKCNQCSKAGHFANCCPDKQAKTAEVKAVSDLNEEIGFLLEVSAVGDSSNLDNDEDECRRRWTAEIQVNRKKVKFKLDSQADVTCVPLCLFKKIMGQQRLVKSDINIRAAEFSELQTVGMFISTLRNGNYEIKEKIYVIRRLSEPLLSRRACELLNLARRIEVVATRINPIKDEMLTNIFEAQQEDTTLKAVVNYLEQGWPDKKKMSPALLSYWHVKDELGFQNGLLMRSCRLVIPASMKLEILDKLHAGHFGITKTRLRARETVWWPGISEEIAETVRKCSVCIQGAVSKHEPLIPTNFPTRPWQKIGMDLFKFENKWYLVVIDYYSRFPEVVQLDRLTASVVVRSCKSIFARHGVPETVVSDNGTQFGAAREFANFARQYGFTHVTSSPRFPQSNGMAEAGVKIAKLILKKNQDPSLGLLEYRSTPLENGYSPAELLMGRKLRTTLPIAPENLNPKLVDSQTLKRMEGRRRKDMKSRYDRRCGATDMEELSEGDTVWITDMRTWGIVKKKASTPRSYMVDTPVGTLRRNRFHLRKGYAVQYPADPSTPTFSGEELVENEKTPERRIVKPGDVLRTWTRTSTYVFPRDAAERDLGCTDVRDKTIYTKFDGLQNPILVNHLEEIREHELKELLEHNRNVFSQQAIDLGKVAIQHKIITKSEQPISLRPYRRPLKEYEEIAEQVKELLEHKLIRISDSPWAFPVVMVPKKDGNKRMCIDYRRLNEITLNDRQPLPHIQDMFDRLHGSRFFSTLDVAWGYWQIEMDPQSIQKTAFVTNDGHYEFLVMPFGLKNAASTFQRIIQHILGELLWKGTCSFQDDILVYTKTWQEHIELLSKVFDKLRQYNMKLKLSKCIFGRTEVKYLGHIISHNQLKPDPVKVKSIQDFPRPDTVKKVRQFMGLANYYRKFVKDFSKISFPLVRLTRKNQPFIWNEEVEESFAKLKMALSTKPVLAIYNPDYPSKVYTDASKYGIGAILTQIGPDNEEHVIAYYSKTLQPHQENYSAYEMEYLAVIQATDHFHVYIENQPFEIITDHAALQWLFTMKKPKPKYFRWILSLSSKSCNIVHRSGKQQTHVDALSRLPVVNIATQELQEHQQNSDLSFLKNFHTHDGVVMIKQKGVFKAVVPNSLTKKILEEYHDSLSHPSITKTCKLITQCYWWKGITTDIKNYVRSCKSCQLVKVRHEPTLGEMINCNGICEKLNDTIMTKLRIAVLEKPRCKWSTLLPQVVKNYNSTPHDVTGFSPLFLKYGIGNVPEFADQTLITIEEARKKANLRTEQSRNFNNLQIYQNNDALPTNVYKFTKCKQDLCPTQPRETAIFTTFPSNQSCLHVADPTPIICSPTIVSPTISPTHDIEISIPSNAAPQLEHCPHELHRILYEFSRVFSTNKYNVPKLNIPPVKINTTTDKIIALRPYRVPLHDQQEIQTQIEQMLQHGIIAPSVSPYASPITLVTKRDKTKRFCIDYRKLNEIIAPDVHPLPLIETILDKLSKAKYYSSVDIASAYWQVEVEPNSRNLLAFVTLDSQYEFCRLPYGFKNSPQIYHRAINQVMQKYKLNFVTHYFDDFIIFSDTLEDHLQHLQQFLTVCQHENIKLNYNKCSFFKTNIDFLGYTVTAGTYAPQTRNLDTISAIKPPTNQKTLQSFLGAVNVYNKFIPDYARLRAPLNKLLKKDVKWNWDPDCQQAFTTLKESLTSKPVLHLYQVGLPCRLYCDASTQGIAGILKQVHPDGQVHPVQYFSRALRAHERNYTVSELECLAIVESVDKFRIYLTGIKFTIYTDHQALQWLKTIKNPSGRLFRWSLRLSTYNYEIHYLKGSQQYEADLLSRNPFVGFISADIIKQHQPTASPFNIDTNGLHTITRKGVIKIIIPETLQHTLMNKVHQEYNHPGISQMTRIITAQYYWKGISKSIEKFVKSCHTCQIIKRPKGKPYGALGQIPPPQQPFDLISIDTIAGFSKYGHSKTYLHVIVDHLTRYAWTFPSKSTSTLTYIQTLKTVLQQGSPKRLLSDRAPAFTSEKFRKFLITHGIQPLLTTSNNPQANGLIERLNATITGKLRLAYLENPKASWTQLVKRVTQ
ncbi:K02A2.6-like, partial [Cordylochernes scorpioides]